MVQRNNLPSVNQSLQITSNQMSKEKSQKEVIIGRLKEVGYVDNFWAIDHNILRLGAIILKLKKEGWQFANNGFGEGRNRKNYHYYLKERQDGCCTDMIAFGQHFGPCKNAQQEKVTAGLF